MLSFIRICLFLGEGEYSVVGQLKGERTGLSKNVDIDEIFKDDHYGEKKNRQ